MVELQIGFGQGDITPKGKVALIGQFDTRLTEEVFTPLKSVAMAICSAESDPVYWAACDLLYITDTLIDAVCRKLSAHIPDFRRSQLMLSATHIHSGPFLKVKMDTTLLSFPCQSSDVLSPESCCEQVAEGIVSSILLAREDVESVLTVRSSSNISTGYCRRPIFTDGTCVMYSNVNVPRFSHMECRDGGDTRMVYVFRKSNHALKGILADVPCTAQVHEHARFIHADYWHYTREYVNNALGVPVFGICACAGDLSPLDLTQKANPNRVEAMRRLGHLVGQALATNVPVPDRADDPAFAHIFRDLRLPRWNPSPAEYQYALELSDLLYKNFALPPGASPFSIPGMPLLLYSQSEVMIKRFQENITEVTAPIHILQIGKALFVTNPFECFVEYSDRIKATFAQLDIFDVQLTDDYLGYLPTVQAVCSGGYSAMLFNGACSPIGGDLLVAETAKTIQSL